MSSVTTCPLPSSLPHAARADATRRVASALHRDDERSVRNLLVQLTPDQRDVVELRLSGLTGVEIADALGKQPGAVRAVQFRAYQRLRELLNEEGGRS